MQAAQAVQAVRIGIISRQRYGVLRGIRSAALPVLAEQGQRPQSFRS